MAEKLYYSMGEVSEMFDVNASLLRHWETQFSVLRPKRNKKGNRLYTPEDIENLKLIYHLVKEQGMTLDGARKALKQRRGDKEATRGMELLERLQRVRSLLVEVREELKMGDGEIVVADDFGSGQEPAAESAAEPKRVRRAKAVVKIEEAPMDTPSESEEKPVRRPRRKKEDAEDKELFAFYEQSLF